MKPIHKIPFASLLVEEVCHELGLGVWIEPDYGYVGYIEYPDGTRHFFRNANFDVNALGSSQIAKDKGYTALLLKKFGYSVPIGEVFFNDILNQRVVKKRTIEDGKNYARSLGYPLIIKPNDLSEGIGVRKLLSEVDYDDAVSAIIEKTQTFRIEKFYSGSDYRVVVFDDEVISVYQRIPLSVDGNGVRTILELIEEKQQIFVESGRDTVIDIHDPRITKNLSNLGYTLESIVPDGSHIQLLDNANLSAGGESIDMTNTIHPDFAETAIRATRDMGLRLCGVDIIVGDISRSLMENENGYIILEINGAPGLDNYLCSGTRQREHVKDLYRKIILALGTGKISRNSGD